MHVFRFATVIAGVACLAGTALAQNSNPLRDDGPYAARLSQVDDSYARPVSWNDPSTSSSPVMKAPVPGGSAAAEAGAPSQNSGNAYEDAAKGNYWNDSGCNSCGNSCGNCCCGCNYPWFAYVGGLTMGRDTANKFWTTYDQNNISHQLLYFPGSDWGGGVDTRIGYWFGCCNSCCDPCKCCNSCGSSGRFGVEAIYWGMWGLDGTATVTSGTNSLGTVQNDGDVYFINSGAGGDASLWFDNARQVTLSRNDEFHNVEVNFLYMPCCDPCNRFQMTALAGIRYFRFTEGLEWDQFAGSVPAGSTTDEAILNTGVKNNLVGFQIGAYLNYQVCDRFGIFAIPKVGVFGNHIEGSNLMELSDGTVARFTANGDALNFNNTKNVCSLMASIDVGFNVALTCHWSWIGGYRVVLATDMALGDNQIPQFFADEAGWKNINSNGDLVLHGAFTGLQARF